MTWLHAVIDVPPAQHAAAAAFWAAATGWPVGEPWDGHPELRSLEPPAGRAYLHLQEVDAAPRVHLDLDADDPDDAVRRAVDLGATLAAEHDRWTTLTSPGGLPFCVARARSAEPPEPVTWPDGHRSRLVQVCIDMPRDRDDAEVAFWRALLPAGRWGRSDSPEFVGKYHDDDGSPLQLLFQRLEEETGPVRAHLDLGTDDLDAEAGRLLALGAEDIGPGHGWHALRDPAGLAFCATGNSPEQTTRRDIG